MVQAQIISSKSSSTIALDELKSALDEQQSSLGEQQSFSNSKIDHQPTDWYRPISAECSIPLNANTLFNISTDQVNDIGLLNHESRSYDTDLAYLCAVIACWSYTDGPVLSNKLSFYGLAGGTMTQFQVINDSLLVSATAFFILSADGKVGVLAFRGTEPENIISIMTDLSSQMTPFVGGEIHSGFYRNTEELWALVSEKIEEEQAKKLETIYITGHSLGGAMSVIAAAKAQLDHVVSWGKLIKGIYTYGQPMVGNDTFASLCQNKFGNIMYRHVYARDVVPRVPTTDIGDFKHFGIERFAAKTNTPWSVVTDPRKIARAPYSIGLTVIGVGCSYVESRIRRALPIQKYLSKWMSEHLWYSIDDHMPLNYIAACKASRD